MEMTCPECGGTSSVWVVSKDPDEEGFCVLCRGSGKVSSEQADDFRKNIASYYVTGRS